MTHLRAAILGCGHMGARHVEILQNSPAVELLAAYDEDRDRLTELLPKTAAAASPEEIFARTDIDVVVIATPSHLHAKHATAAAASGKHVIVEKPLDTDPAAARALVEVCRAKNLVCATVSQFRFADGYGALRLALERQLLGKPVLVRGAVRWFRHDRYYTSSSWRAKSSGEGGGVLINQAVHLLDLLFWYFGEPVSWHAETACNRAVMDFEDTATLNMRFQNDLLATVEASTSAFPGFEDRLEVQGLLGSCFVEGGKVSFWASEFTSEAPKAEFPETMALVGEKNTSLARQYENILAAIRGEQPLLVKPEEAIRVVDFVNQVYAKTRR